MTATPIACANNKSNKYSTCAFGKLQLENAPVAKIFSFTK